MPEKIKVGLMTHAGGAHVGAYLTALAASEECDAVVLADPDLELGPGRGQLNPSFLRPPMHVLDVAAGREDTEALTEARSRGCLVVEPDVVWRSLAGSLYRSITGSDLPDEDHPPQ